MKVMPIPSLFVLALIGLLSLSGCSNSATDDSSAKSPDKKDDAAAAKADADTAAKTDANASDKKDADAPKSADEGDMKETNDKDSPAPADETATAQASEKETSGVKKENWGSADGKEVFLFTLTNKNGTTAKLTNWGATVTELHVKDKDGQLADVVLGYESLERWLDSDGQGSANPSYFGCTVGRYCNRIANGTFELDGETYKLAQNNDPSHLHGGEKGWDKKVWDSEILEREDGQAVRFTLVSPDGDEGYPGKVEATVIYSLTNDDSLGIVMVAESDAPTPVSMTNHSYFNLSGEGNGTILDHELKLETDRYTVFGPNDIPTGEIKSVEGTPFDFTKPTSFGARIGELAGDPGGYDQNFKLRDEKEFEPTLAATVYDPKSGREMQVLTTEVGLQVYTGNYLDGSLVGKSGKQYEKNFGFCLEPQFHPNSPNTPTFPSCILKPGEQYIHVTVYRFGIRE